MMNHMKISKISILFLMILAMPVVFAQVGKVVDNAVTNPAVQTPEKDVVSYDFTPNVKMFGRSLFDTGGETFMPNPDAPVPDNYALGTGDKLEIICWSENVEYERSVQTITPTGDIFLKTIGNMPVARKTIYDLRRDLRTKYSKLYTTFNLTVNLVGQRTMPVYVMGEVKKPGKYILPSLATVFTALFSAGGPTDIGSLRSIKLMRGTKLVALIDIYEYLLDGKYVDQPLQSGDTIYIPMSGKIVSVYGAVNRAAKYELVKETTVDDVMKLSGGLTSKASNKIRIMRIDSVSGQTVRELFNDAAGKLEKVQNGDEIYIRPVLDVLQNAVTVIGAVNRPGPFPADMAPTVSKLIALAGGLIDDEAYIEQAVITRLRDNSSSYQIPFNLRAVMEGKPGADLALQAKDTLKVISKKNMVQSLDMVTIQGEVTQPGSYPFVQGMKISDLVNLGFGTTINSYLKQTHLFRFPVNITNTGSQSPGQPEVITVDLTDILNGNKKADLELRPRDMLKIYARTEVSELQDVVIVQGEVVKPGTYPFYPGMKIADLLKICFGTTTNAFLDQAFIYRHPAAGTTETKQETLIVNISSIMNGDKIANIELKQRDTLKIFNRSELTELNDTVSVSGEVVKPGTFPFRKGMKIADLLSLSFGTTMNAYLDQAFIYRYPAAGTTETRKETIIVNITNVINGNKEANIELKQRDTLKIFNRSELTELNDTVSINGEVVKAGSFPYREGMRVSDILSLSFGTTINAYLDQAFIYRYPTPGTNDTKKETIIINVSNIMNGDKNANIELKPRDTIKIFNRGELPELNDIISISGEVVKPGVFPFKEGMKVSDLLNLSFGTTMNAYLDQAFIYRLPTAGTTETKKETIIINVTDIIAGNKEANIVLKARDTIKIFNRSELGELTDIVSITGEVVKPGSFPFKTGMKVADVLKLSFGTTTNAYLDQAFIYRYPTAGTTETKKETIIINVSDIIAGNKEANIELKARDNIKIFNRSELSELTDSVVISGEVVKPGAFPYMKGMKISDLLRLSFGTTINSYLDQAHLYRYPTANTVMKIGENQQDVIIININNILNGDISADLELKPRDTVKIYKREEVSELIGSVSIMGEVIKPGVYPYSVNMKISDLIAKAFGVTTKAYLRLAQLYRYPSSNESVLISFNLDGALAKNVADDYILQPRDRIEIKANSDVVESSVTVVGEVNKPALIPYYKGMKVSDAIFISGGLKPNVTLDKALIIRLDEKTMLEQMIEISLRDALSIKEKDIELNRRDKLFIYPKENLGNAQSVSITGAVTSPGFFPFVEGLTVSQLIFLAKGLLNSSYPDRANLYRTREDKNMEIIPVNLVDAVANVKDANVLLKPGDKLSVMTREEIMDSKTVVVRGYVRKPGILPLTVGMKLSDALALSGGLNVSAEPKVMIFRVLNGETKSMDYVVKTNQNSYSLDVDPILENKDLITVRGNSELVTMTETITIEGNVLHPGTYPAYAGNRLNAKSLYQLITEAGGIMANGYPAGLLLYRPNSSIQNTEQKREMDRLLHDLDTSSGATSMKVPAIQGSTAQDASQQNVNILSSQVARAILSEKSGKIIILTPPRSMQEQQISITIPVEADKIIKSKGKSGDIKLLPGDSVYVPEIPTTVTVLGGVFSNGSVVYQKSDDLDKYVKAVGGFSKDAEPEHMVILRMNGMVMPARRSSKVLPGDIIIVPTTFIIKNIHTDNLFEASLRTISELALSYLPFKN